MDLTDQIQTRALLPSTLQSTCNSLFIRSQIDLSCKTSPKRKKAAAEIIITN